MPRPSLYATGEGKAYASAVRRETPPRTSQQKVLWAASHLAPERTMPKRNSKGVMPTRRGVSDLVKSPAVPALAKRRVDPLERGGAGDEFLLPELIERHVDGIEQRVEIVG